MLGTAAVSTACSLSSTRSGRIGERHADGLDFPNAPQFARCGRSPL